MSTTQKSLGAGSPVSFVTAVLYLNEGMFLKRPAKVLKYIAECGGVVGSVREIRDQFLLNPVQAWEILKFLEHHEFIETERKGREKKIMLNSKKMAEISEMWKQARLEADIE